MVELLALVSLNRALALNYRTVKARKPTESKTNKRKSGKAAKRTKPSAKSHRPTSPASVDATSNIVRLRHVIRFGPQWRILADDPNIKVTEYKEHGVLVNWRNHEFILPYPSNVSLVDGSYVLDQIDQNMKRLAYMCAYDIRTSKAGGNDKTKSNYPFFNDFKGQLGNLVASYVLLGGDAHATEEVTIGRPDKVDLQYKGATIDVKTSEYNGLNLSAKQFTNGSKYDYYVAVKVNRESDDTKAHIEENWRDATKIPNDLLSRVFTRAEVIGYLRTSEAPALVEMGSKWHQIPRRELKAITKLEEILRNRQPTDSHTA